MASIPYNSKDNRAVTRDRKTQMSTLKKRISSLENGARGEPTLVMIHSWLGEGEYAGLTHGDTVIRRQSGETEEVFLERAERELLEQFGNPPVFTCFAIRESELEAR
jgi:hypothetical protein